MVFQKGNKLWNNPKCIETRIKKGEHRSTKTEFKKGHVCEWKGKGIGTDALGKYAWETLKDKEKICENCGEIKRRCLVSHHKNKNRFDNSIINLQILCRSCHARHHGKESNEGQYKKGHKPTHGFKKGHKPINGFKKGRVPWNKGIKNTR